MKRTLIRYRTHADRADANQRLVEAVFAELGVKRPAGVRYTTVRAPDSTFFHLVCNEADGPSPILGLDAFRAFQEGIRARCVEPPAPVEVALVGSYRMGED